MEKIDQKTSTYVQLFTFTLIWICLIKFLGHQNLDSVNFKEAAIRLPQAVGIYFIVLMIFTKWAWRFKIFQKWLIKMPYLQGTWKGELKSSWVNPKTGLGVDPIPATLVIKHDFHKITCRLFTQESQSFSISADITIGPDGAMCLSYTYTNKPLMLIRDRSAIHDGAAILQVLGKPKKRSLEGSYWTSRQTFGTMTFNFKSSELDDKFVL